MLIYPLLLKPPIKDYLWGGTRLKTEYNYETDLTENPNLVQNEGYK